MKDPDDHVVDVLGVLDELNPFDHPARMSSGQVDDLVGARIRDPGVRLQPVKRAIRALDRERHAARQVGREQEAPELDPGPSVDRVGAGQGVEVTVAMAVRRGDGADA